MLAELPLPLHGRQVLFSLVKAIRGYDIRYEFQGIKAEEVRMEWNGTEQNGTERVFRRDSTRLASIVTKARRDVGSIRARGARSGRPGGRPRARSNPPLRQSSRGEEPEATTRRRDMQCAAVRREATRGDSEGIRLRDTRA